jgi:hypothetical protein
MTKNTMGSSRPTFPNAPSGVTIAWYQLMERRLDGFEGENRGSEEGRISFFGDFGVEEA